jgi:hypothetical protein
MDHIIFVGDDIDLAKAGIKVSLKQAKTTLV